MRIDIWSKARLFPPPPDTWVFCRMFTGETNALPHCHSSRELFSRELAENQTDSFLLMMVMRIIDLVGHHRHVSPQSDSCMSPKKLQTTDLPSWVHRWEKTQISNFSNKIFTSCCTWRCALSARHPEIQRSSQQKTWNWFPRQNTSELECQYELLKTSQLCNSVERTGGTSLAAMTTVKRCPIPSVVDQFGRWCGNRQAIGYRHWNSWRKNNLSKWNQCGISKINLSSRHLRNRLIVWHKNTTTILPKSWKTCKCHHLLPTATICAKLQSQLLSISFKSIWFAVCVNKPES